MDPPIRSRYLNKWLLILVCCIILVVFLVVLDFQLYEAHKPKEGGISIIAPDPEKERITFEQALLKLAPNNADFGLTKISENFSIRYVRANKLDLAGRSVSWLFGVKEGENCSFYTVNRESVSWQPGVCTKLHEITIPVESIKSPGEVISLHRTEIMGSLHVMNATIDTIEIDKGNITLIQQDTGTVRSLTFNSFNGELVSE